MADMCTIRVDTVGPDMTRITLTNDLISVSVLPDKGADIYELSFSDRGLDVLWKSPWGPRRIAHGPSSADYWTDLYPGGWQELFPTGGPACTFMGVEQSMHGEASLAPWIVNAREESSEEAAVRLSVRLSRTPIRLERNLSIRRGSPVLLINERATNEGGVPVPYMWGHHPAFGGPFLRGQCFLETNARWFDADDRYDGAHNPLEPGRRSHWPRVDGRAGIVDLRAIPELSRRRQLLGYLSGFDGTGETAWFALQNHDLGLGVALSWDRTQMPFAWVFQEMNATDEYPWFGNSYLMAVEPNTSWPGQGLVTVMERTGTHRTLVPGESHELTLRATLFQSNTTVTGVSHDGSVVVEARSQGDR